ncbi:MAG TPA: rod shape-determining protein MreD [Streptosporangiaceae bacterium]|nr:rod shape-determining protein MreD [Streptosporangiaceae bacterium]
MRALVSLVLTAVTVVVQVTIVDRIAFPGGGGPNLVLLLVAALALAGGPMAGLLTGFLAGLALDVAPPGSHFTGQDALVFCLIGYACGLLADDFSGDAEHGRSALFEIAVTAAGAVCGEALVALLGVMLSDPQVRWPAITNVLPAALAYDVLLCPFVLYAAAAALRVAGVRREGRRPGWSPSQARTPVPATNQGAIRQLAAGGGPRLRLAERDRGPVSVGIRRGSGAGRPAARREPKLKLGRPGTRPSARAGGAFASGGLAGGSARVKFGGRRRQGVLGGSLLGGASRGGSGLGRSLLGGSVFSRSSSSIGSGSSSGRTTVFGRSAPLGRSSPFRHRGNLMGSAGGGLTRRSFRLSRASTPKSPGRNWLRGTSTRGRALGASKLGASKLGGSKLGRSKLGGTSLGRGRSLSRGAFGGRRVSQPRLGAPSRFGRNRSGRSRWGRGGYR